jgi:1-deoxy-D-xylulose-5-phosphate synthase
VFGKGLAELAEENEKIVAVTAAMPSGTGTGVFAAAHPDRFFDVGIAEGHAVTFAAGMATRGVRPVCAIYSTFLQRAYDNVIHDVSIQHLPVVFAMDRAGLVGEDGPTHMGLYDIAYMLAVPGMTVAAPKNGREMLGLLRTAVAHEDGPFAFRYPRDAAPDIVPPIAEVEAVPFASWEIVRNGAGSRDPAGGLAILAVGTMVLPSVDAADILAADGISATVVNCRFMKPYDEAALKEILAEHRYVLVVEEGTIVNGFGAYMSSVIASADPGVRVMAHGVPDVFIEQAPRARQLAEVGLDAQGIAARARVLRQIDARGARLRAG